MATRIAEKALDMARVRSGYSSSSGSRRKLATATHQVDSLGSRMMKSAAHGRGGDHVFGFMISVVLAVVAAGFVLFLNNPPVVSTNGKLAPVAQDGTVLNRPIQPGDRVEVTFDQNWKQLCPVRITPIVKGEDGFPKSAEPILVGPPDKVGMRPAKRYFTFPYVVDGDATYHAIMEPDCWFDKIFQRHFVTDDIPFSVMALKK